MKPGVPEANFQYIKELHKSTVSNPHPFASSSRNLPAAGRRIKCQECLA